MEIIWIPSEKYLRELLNLECQMDSQSNYLLMKPLFCIVIVILANVVVLLFEYSSWIFIKGIEIENCFFISLVKFEP